jgi:hypothetical protein
MVVTDVGQLHFAHSSWEGKGSGKKVTNMGWDMVM